MKFWKLFLRGNLVRSEIFSTSIVIFLAVPSWAHTIMNTPTPRVGTTDSTKTSNSATNPCGGVARGSVPLVMTVGSSLTMSWTETVNHSGRFIVQFSPENDQGFELSTNELYRKEDTEDRATHLATIKLPSTPCDACTLRLVQVMDDQPGVQYVNCTDIRLMAASTTLPPGTDSGGTPTDPGGQSSQSSASSIGANKSEMPGGCSMASGRISKGNEGDEKKNKDGNGSLEEGISHYFEMVFMLILLLPMVVLARLRSSGQPALPRL